MKMFRNFTNNDKAEYIYQYADILAKSIMSDTFDINIAKNLYEIASSNNFTPKQLEHAQIESCLRLWSLIGKYQQLTIENRYKFKKLLNICTAIPNNIKTDWNNKISFNQNEILAHYKILCESIDIFDNTKNLEIAIIRYNLIIEKFNIFNFCDENELSLCDIDKKSLLNILKNLQQNRINLFNEIVDRIYNDKINYIQTLKSQKAKINNINKTLAQIKAIQDLPQSTLQYANTLFNNFLNSIETTDKTSTSLILQNTDITRTQQNNIINKIPKEIIDLLWFYDGPLKNYEIKPIKQNYSSFNNISFTFSIYGQTEPSAISVKLPIGTPLHPVPKIGYFPTYKDLSADEKATYLNWLSNIDNPIDIGYVFIFYYGLERFLYFDSNKSEKAFNLILRLRNKHINNSFHSYSSNALYSYALANHRQDLLKKLISIDTDNTDILHLDCMAELNMNLSINQILNISSTIGFKNKRYIKLHPDLFANTLKSKLIEKYSISEYPLSKKHIQNTQTIPIPICANISIEPRWINIPNILTNKDLSLELLTLLSETHEKVKYILKENRKNK